MIDQELNKKLAEWAGFKYIELSSCPECSHSDGGYWLKEGIGRRLYPSDMPNFTQSLDVCFKWLVPKLWVCQYVLDEAIFHVWTVSRPNKEGEAPPRCSALDEFNSALALCLAVEKLIDGERK